jgi:hypothetical protein
MKILRSNYGLIILILVAQNYAHLWKNLQIYFTSYSYSYIQDFTVEFFHLFFQTLSHDLGHSVASTWTHRLRMDGRSWPSRGMSSSHLKPLLWLLLHICHFYLRPHSNISFSLMWHANMSFFLLTWHSAHSCQRGPKHEMIKISLISSSSSQFLLGTLPQGRGRARGGRA